MPVAKKTQPVKKAATKKAAPTPRKTTARKQTQTNNNSGNRNEQRKMHGEVGRVGNVGSDPELRYTPNGRAVCSFSLAYTPYNFETKEQGETVWYDILTFNALAEQTAICVQKGMRVIVWGNAQTRTWEYEGDTKSRKEILANALGPDIHFAQVSVQKIQRTTPNSRNGDTYTQYEDEEPF